MAKRRMSDDQLKLVQRLTAGNGEELDEKVNAMARRIFDVSLDGDFEQALGAVYLAGMQAATKPKRQRKAKAAAEPQAPLP